MGKESLGFVGSRVSGSKHRAGARRYSTQEDRLEMLAAVLEWGHLVLAPSPQEACLKADHQGFLGGFQSFNIF